MKLLTDVREIRLEDHISKHGIEKIDTYIFEITMRSLPFDFDWRWKTPEGKLTKRIKNYMYKFFGVRLADDEVENIGNYASQFYVQDQILYYDITDELSWKAGQFGDSNSCFWTCRSAARGMLTENGGLAIRLWKKENNEYCGYARAWLYPLAEDIYVVFNAYGERLHTFASIIGQLTELPSRPVELVNNDVEDGTLWINSGQGMVIAPASFDEDIIDLEIPDDRDRTSCEYCGTFVDDEDILYVDEVSICERCFDANYIYCDDCGHATHHDNTFEHRRDVICGFCHECRITQEHQEEEEEEYEEQMAEPLPF